MSTQFSYLDHALASAFAVALLATAHVGHAQPASAPDHSALKRDGTELASRATLDQILKIALAHSPHLSEASHRYRAAAAQAPAAGRWPEPEFEYQLWAAPLGRPYALGDAEMHMFGVRQSIPAPGTLSARSDAAAAQARIVRASQRGRELELRARVRRAFAEYRRAEAEYALHAEHVRLASATRSLVQATYGAGRGSQQDVLRASLEASRLDVDLVTIDRDRRSARALLNALMARPLDAALGPAEPFDGQRFERELQALQRELAPSAALRKPEVESAENAVQSGAAELHAARSAARWPSFMLGVQYMYMPPADDAHNYGVMFSMSLPWLNPGYAQEVSSRSAALAADRAALAGARLTARYELYEVTERLSAARQSLALVERELLPRAQSSFESVQAAYAGGQFNSLALLDALQVWLEVRIQRVRAQAELELAVADAELASGATRPNRAALQNTDGDAEEQN